MALRFRRDVAFTYGLAERVSPLVRRVMARNPSPYTHAGTATFIIGHGDVAIIDPGPIDLPEHLAALLDAVKGERVRHILVTHAHLDHSPLARALQDAVQAPILAQGGECTGSGGAEAGGDVGFRPDAALGDGAVVSGPGWTLEAIETPGHASDHLCFALNEEATIFSGDHVMGWSTTVVSPPDGDMAAYFASLGKIRRRSERLYRPTHGPEIADGPAYTGKLLAHRRLRERQILRQLGQTPATVPDLVRANYPALRAELYGAAGRSVLAHLRKLRDEGRVGAEDGEIWHLVD